MTFRKTVLAYLTGWLIVQPVYSALRRWWLKRELANPSPDTVAHYEHQAKAFVDALEGYTPGQEPPAALAVLLKQHERISELEESVGLLFTGEQLRLLMRFAHIEGWRGEGRAECLEAWTPEAAIERFMQDAGHSSAFVKAKGR